MPLTMDTRIICEDPDFPGPDRRRIILDLSEQTATFENCHWPRKSLSSGYDAVCVCRFEDLLAAHDFLSGEHRGRWLRTVLSLGHLTSVAVKPSELESIFISTSFGRCRVFADWNGFEEFRQGLREVCKASPAGHWSDDPRLIPLYVVIMLAVAGGLIWWLL